MVHRALPLCTMLLIIDNYDSFTYNLVQGFGALDPDIKMHIARNDEITIEAIEQLAPEHIVLSPGPCTPREAGICNQIITHFKGLTPILGVCLGHQCIGAAHGMIVTRADEIMHGKTSEIYHDQKGIFAGLPNPFTATRYHSLIVQRDTVDLNSFTISAWTSDNIIMGLRWQPDAPPLPHLQQLTTPPTAPLIGVQFHPESFLTQLGPQLLANFLAF